MAGEHTHKTTSWVTVALLVLASVVIGVAFPLESIALGVVGAVIGLAGLVTAVVFGLMDDAH